MINVNVLSVLMVSNYCLIMNVIVEIDGLPFDSCLFCFVFSLSRFIGLNSSILPNLLYCYIHNRQFVSFLLYFKASNTSSMFM